MKFLIITGIVLVLPGAALLFGMKRVVADAAQEDERMFRKMGF